MKIAIDARFLNATPSPLAQYCENLIEHLAQVDEQNRYVVFIHSSYPRTLRVGDNFEVRPLRARPLSWRTLARFQKQVERADADVLHSLYPIVPLPYRGKLLVTIHDLKPLMLDEADPERFYLTRGLSRQISRWLFPIAVRRATWLSAISNTTRDGLAELFPETFHKTVVTHSGLEPSYQAPLDSSTLELVRAQNELPEKYLFYTGSVRPSKNMARMLAAYAELRKSDERFASLYFLVDSSPSPWLEEMKRLARRLGVADVVQFLGQVADSERRALYALAQAFCFPCKNEGFGLPILEAQASGAPVVAADSGAIPEVAGRGALLFDPDDTQAIVEALRLVLTTEHLRRDLMETGRQNVERFSWRSTAEKVRDIYNYLM
ncbi:MAG: glycosyltransferase family 1 protein [Candidatus Sumerlaeota bacterium]|nr:glycosyltransferase family 1 protein [Candidatus Sumerlaeota bacterium]